jgi:hypothetical protein
MMHLSDALAASQPDFPCLHKARIRLPNGGTVVVMYDGWWGVTYQGSPIPFWSRGDLLRFLQQEGIPLAEGWMPQIAGSGTTPSSRRERFPR